MAITFIPARFDLDEGITFELAAGHSPGHSCVKITAGEPGAFIVGDAFHLPHEIYDPSLGARGDIDPPMARSTRRLLLEQCAINGWLLMPAHFPTPFCVIEIERRGSGFIFSKPSSQRFQ